MGKREVLAAICSKHYKKKTSVIINTSRGGVVNEKDLNEISTIDKNGINIHKSELGQLGGLISDINLRYDKNNNQWAIILLDTQFGNIQVYIFHNTYIKYIDYIKKDLAIFIKGSISAQTDDYCVTQLIANKIFPLANIRKRLITKVNIRFTFNAADSEALNMLYEVCTASPGNCNIILHMLTSTHRAQKILINKHKINSNGDTLEDLRKLFGNKNVWIS